MRCHNISQEMLRAWRKGLIKMTTEVRLIPLMSYFFSFFFVLLFQRYFFLICNDSLLERKTLNKFILYNYLSKSTSDREKHNLCLGLQNYRDWWLLKDAVG